MQQEDEVLDLFSCAGAASVGYSRAGFKPTGVDIVSRRRYPFTLVVADAVGYLKRLIDSGEIDRYKFVHASPPCQDQCTLTLGTNAGKFEYPNFYAPIKQLMELSGIPGVIENPQARPDVTLCGEMFGLGVLRHRKFELVNWSTPKPDHVKHRGRVKGWRHGVYYDGPYIAAYGKGGGKGSVAEMQDAMDIHWTDKHEELTEAIPPAYTEWVGRRFAEWKADQ